MCCRTLKTQGPVPKVGEDDQYCELERQEVIIGYWTLTNPTICFNPAMASEISHSCSKCTTGQDGANATNEHGWIREKKLVAWDSEDSQKPDLAEDVDVGKLMEVARIGCLSQFQKSWNGNNLNFQVRRELLTDIRAHADYLKSHAQTEATLRTKYTATEDQSENSLPKKDGVGDDQILEKALIEKYGKVEGRLLNNALTTLHPGRTALHMAAVNGQWETVAAICAVKAVQVNFKDIFGYTALHLASLSPHPNRKRVIEKLLEKNVHDRIEANVTSHEEYPHPDGKFTPLHFAVKGKFKKIVENLLEWKPETGKYRNTTIDLTVRSRKGWTPLHLAIIEKNKKKPLKDESKDLKPGKFDKSTSIIRTLIKHISKHCPEAINTRTRSDDDNDNGWTPLHMSVAFGDYDVVEMLLTICEKQIDPEAKDHKGKTPMDIAIQQGDYTMVLKLQNYLESVGLFGSQKAYANAGNTILVVAALLATVTFTPPSTSESTIFWVFYNLSFYFAISTLLSGAGASMPSRGSTIAHVRGSVYAASVCLAISLSCAVGAFATAAIDEIAPGIPHQRLRVIATTTIGGLFCLYFLIGFVRALARAYSPLFFYADYNRKVLVYNYVSKPLGKLLRDLPNVEWLEKRYKDMVLDPPEKEGRRKISEEAARLLRD